MKKEYGMLNIGICDDNRETCAKIEEVLYEYKINKEIQAEIEVWYTGEGLCRDLKYNKLFLDILFLDLDLLTTDGVKVGRFIREALENTEIMIVYISANSSYAMELFQVQPLDFLIKPIEADKIRNTMDKMMRLAERRNHIFEYFSGGYYFKLKYGEIMYFASQNKKIQLIFKSGRKEFNGKLNEVAKKVPSDFIRVHQSYLINFDFIEEYTYDSIKMINGEIIPVSQNYRKSVREQIAKRIWKERE